MKENNKNVCDTCAYFDWWNAECMLDDECKIHYLHEKLAERRNQRRRRKLSKLSDVLCLRPANDVRWFVVRTIGR